MKEKIFEKIISRRGILAFTSIFSLVLVSSLVILNYIPQDTSQTKGYFSSGNHTIESWISSYDSLSGSQLDTWLS
ncbi:MAG: hypothetical protein KGD63_15255, partial [Candidatus Lokiarchaeota archaeon]|nr:hypothetical protein [Candidatus Lokiarchaeota archaeon]